MRKTLPKFQILTQPMLFSLDWFSYFTDLCRPRHPEESWIDPTYSDMKLWWTGRYSWHLKHVFTSDNTTSYNIIHDFLNVNRLNLVSRALCDSRVYVLRRGILCSHKDLLKAHGASTPENEQGALLNRVPALVENQLAKHLQAKRMQGKYHRCGFAWRSLKFVCTMFAHVKCFFIDSTSLSGIQNESTRGKAVGRL